MMKLNILLQNITMVKKQIAFEYNETMIIQVKLSSESNSTIDKEKLINELIQNYRVIV